MRKDDFMVKHIKNFLLGTIISGLFYIIAFVITLITQIPAYIFGYTVWFILMAVIMGIADIFSYDFLLEKFGEKIKVLLIQSGSIFTIFSLRPFITILRFYDFHGDDNCDHVFLFPFFMQAVCIIGGLAVSLIWRKIQKRRAEAK